ncbi:uncharacterized protein P174DRAFT_418662 [Aspergillus novofumigatus IBT 16806]|uniref:Uncharacterized protein n=1 Tax=Aspergillus novofumigatus (strain IBT 16806) TaxID=1392255 RepID=A0A2I1CJB4_ASPN1|nr:uncharacterized protein P174DRAFT_418662 [Aspergillus novofumigatus IBT 16806]PKX97722.1 hypothetical protein P174DRAFT_418662 [Aspergillus novofumigatus IBT 16806]
MTPDDGDTQPEKNKLYTFASLRNILAVPSSSRWYNYAGMARCPPQTPHFAYSVLVPDEQAISSSTRVSPSSLTPARTRRTLLASPGVSSPRLCTPQQLVEAFALLLDMVVRPTITIFAPRGDPRRHREYSGTRSQGPKHQHAVIGRYGSAVEIATPAGHGKCVSADLGQVAGHGYTFRQAAATLIASSASSTVIYDAASVLKTRSGDSLVAPHGGLHVIPVHDPVVTLALLGKI